VSEQLRKALEPFRHMRVEVKEKADGGDIFDLREGKRVAVGSTRNAALAHEWNSYFEAVRAALTGPDWTAPLPELQASKPVVLYFQNDEDRDDFVKMMHESSPDLVAKKL
jgi:hypothetical protein